MVVAVVSPRADSSRSTPTLISGDPSLIIYSWVVLLYACMDHHFIFSHLTVCLIDSQLLLMDAAMVRSTVASSSSVFI